MSRLAADLNGFFYSSINGFEALLSDNRLKNKKLIKDVYECLLKENYFTDSDINHLRNFKLLVDLVKIPRFYDSKSFIETEVYLQKQIIDFDEFKLKWSLEYLFFLFLKNGLVKTQVENARIELCIWRIVHKFSFLEHNILTHYIDWLAIKDFSKIAILNSITELYKLCNWLEAQELDFEQINDLILGEYLFERIQKLKSTTRSKTIANIKPFLVFFMEELNPEFKLPRLTATCNKNKFIEHKLSSQEIIKLEEATYIEENLLEGALMLHLMLEYGVQLKSLPLIQIGENKLLYELRLPSRLGYGKREIIICKETLLSKLVRKLERNQDNQYLFQNIFSSRKNKLVSIDYCQDKFQEFISKILGFSVSAQQVYRDALKHRAKGKKLTEFIDESSSFEVSKRTKLNYWLSTYYQPK